MAVIVVLLASGRLHFRATLFHSSLILFCILCNFSPNHPLLLFIGNAAIFDYATGGPCFGSSDLIIGEPKAAVMGGFAGPDMEDTSINAGDLKKGKSSGLLAYREEQGRFPVRGNFRLVELEVYCNAQFKDASTVGSPSWWPF
jgi:hypothetical protein